MQNLSLTRDGVEGLLSREQMKKITGGVNDYVCQYDILMSNGEIYHSEGLCSAYSNSDCRIITASTIGATERMFDGTYVAGTFGCSLA
jgi:hypothetical protein